MCRATFPPCAHDRERGVSLIETLIATALLLVTALGIAPLLMRAQSDTLRGRETTRSAAAAAGRLDELLGAAFDAAPLALGRGQSERRHDAAWTQGDPRVIHDAAEGWIATPTPSPGLGRVLWRRTTRVRQLALDHLGLPLPGGAPPGTVHLKEIDVTVATLRQGNGLGAPVITRVRVLKAF